jgi:hypothetical protein
MSETRPAGEPRGSAEIAAEIGETKAALGDTVAALARKLDPHALLDRITAMLKRSSFGEDGNFTAMLRANALPLGLIGAGVAWLAVDLLRGRPEDRDRAKEPPDIGGGPSEPASTAAESDAPAAGSRESVMLGLAGLALGALAGAVLPAGRRESELVAEAREDLWSRAEGLSRDLADRIRRAGAGANSDAAGHAD